MPRSVKLIREYDTTMVMFSEYINRWVRRVLEERNARIESDLANAVILQDFDRLDNLIVLYDINRDYVGVASKLDPPVPTATFWVCDGL